MPLNKSIGRFIPNVILAQSSDMFVRSVELRGFIGEEKALIFGVPGAFTPVCSQQHVPDFVQNARRLRRAGFTRLICVAPNDPFTLRAWERTVDPEGELTFLSDGNHELARALAVVAKHPAYFLGHGTFRYLLTAHGGRITHFAVEPAVELLTCTRSCDILNDDRSPSASGQVASDELTLVEV